jgi:glutamate-5-semialdehyde dehydrogenase
VASLPDPLGEVIEESTHANGMEIRKVRVPIGVIGIIYESRPNVTVDCAALCLKSGNASILRGGKEARHSNKALAALVSAAVVEAGLPPESVQLVPTTDREALVHLLRDAENVDCIIPRGGEGLIRFTAETALMPVIKHYKGVCNLYVDTEAEAQMAIDLAVNAKTQRPSVCNAIENLILHRDLRGGLSLEIAKALAAAGVELRVFDADLREAFAAAGVAVKEATEADFSEEYLDNVLAVKEVEDEGEAIAFINQYGSKHSDAIVTADASHAHAFLDGVDSATVYWNASTRFTDGFEFGLGAEIGISTDKLHARGPMGLRELCTYKFLITGTGQVRS